jgi:hypothetical protein
MKPETTKQRITKALAPVAPKEELLPAELSGTWGAEGVDNDDIILPRLLLMQSMSEMVSEKETAEPGDIVKSTNETVMGGRDKPLRIIPLSVFKTWTLEMKEGSKFVWKANEPMTPQNVNRPIEWTDELKNEWRANKVLNFYVLIQNEIAPALAGEGTAIPCLVSFRRTSYMTGRKLASGINESRFMGQPAAARSYELKVAKKTNDLGTWYVYDLGIGTKTTTEEVRYAKQWFDSLSANQVKVHDITDEA